jgi:hypothetical protein
VCRACAYGANPAVWPFALCESTITANKATMTANRPCACERDANRAFAVGEIAAFRFFPAGGMNPALLRRLPRGKPVSSDHVGQKRTQQSARVAKAVFAAPRPAHPEIYRASAVAGFGTDRYLPGEQRPRHADFDRAAQRQAPQSSQTTNSRRHRSSRYLTAAGH